MFCTIAIVFNDHQRLERVYQFYTKCCIYYSYYNICSIVCAVTTKTIVYAVLRVKLIYSLRPLNIITQPPKGSRPPQFGKPWCRVPQTSKMAFTTFPLGSQHKRDSEEKSRQFACFVLGYLGKALNGIPPFCAARWWGQAFKFTHRGESI